MANLPTPGGDDGNWGTLLNQYLLQEHNSDGSHGLATGLVTDVVNTQSIGATYTLPSPTAAGMHYLTLTASLTLPTPTEGQSFTLVLKQGGAGSYTITGLPRLSGVVEWLRRYLLRLVKLMSSVFSHLTAIIGSDLFLDKI